MDNRECDYEGCEKPALPAGLVYGRAYCKEHYLSGLERAFHDELISLDRESPSSKFKNLLGRYIQELYETRDMQLPEGLTTSKLRDRTAQVHYEDDAISFVIERHPEPVPIRQLWRFNLKARELTLIKDASVYLGCEEAAEQLGRSMATVRRYIAQGKIKARKASDIPEVDGWFAHKVNKGRLDIHYRRTSIIPPNRWLIAAEEVERLMKDR